jgi:ribulose-phosphate 3-epimerase
MDNIVSPSLLACDFLNIQSEIEQFKGYENLWFHLDIMDGHFVPNLTFGHEITSKVCRKTKIPCDAHFMVSNPEFYCESFKDFGLYNFTFHIEATDDPLKLLLEAKKFYPSVGISLKPKTSFSSLSPELLKNLDLLLIMSVEPGFGGQSFIEGTWDKLKMANQYRLENDSKFSIQIDGGVSDANAKRLRTLGANNLVAGSYIFKQGPNTYRQKVDSIK